ncbi:MAG: hypothetical protein R2705_17295 [Ilumatobacteraceae bacterium]
MSLFATNLRSPIEQANTEAFRELVVQGAIAQVQPRSTGVLAIAEPPVLA